MFAHRPPPPSVRRHALEREAESIAAAPRFVSRPTNKCIVSSNGHIAILCCDCRHANVIEVAAVVAAVAVDKLWITGG